MRPQVAPAPQEVVLEIQVPGALHGLEVRQIGQVLERRPGAGLGGIPELHH